MKNIQRIFGTDHNHSHLVFIFPTHLIYYTFRDYERAIKEFTHIGIINNKSQLRYLVNTCSPLIHESYSFIYDNAEYDIKNEIWLIKDSNPKFVKAAKPKSQMTKDIKFK